MIAALTLNPIRQHRHFTPAVSCPSPKCRCTLTRASTTALRLASTTEWSRAPFEWAGSYTVIYLLFFVLPHVTSRHLTFPHVSSNDSAYAILYWISYC
eukprot:1270600-Pleurochrysis_carterae.AAC.1